jgi:hypothetical protein
MLGYCVLVTMKIPFPKENKKAVPSQLERVTNQRQPVVAGGTAQTRVTHEHSFVKDRKRGGFLPRQNSSQNQAGGQMAGKARVRGGEPCPSGAGRIRGTRPSGGKGGGMRDRTTEIFGEPVYCYTRRQAIEDGVLVDLMQPETVGLVREAGFKFPLAMTAGAFAATVAKIGEPLPAGQNIQGRLWDVLWMLSCAIKAAGSTDRVNFRVSVWDGKRHSEARLWAHCGPGDDAAPVVTIMLEGED